ncbi:DUF3137 domain-containing protein [Mycoplasma procyoni]|uniref:DUF3137 domain-containing protein n=1 Tax=Mycoplasma procyoni TaxID=568784 RepID=UPI00197C6883|nr:DUF3137 domain-containing protein [Mycoplasma procyoni]MBN3535024.1 HPP family protein [Mycoplasma procyoni]
MKRVNDYKTFSEFRKISDKEFYPVFKEAIAKGFENKDLIDWLKKLKIAAIATFVASMVMVLVSFIVIITQHFAIGGWLFVLAILILIAWFIIFRIYTKRRNEIFDDVLKKIPIEDLYAKAFETLESSIRYLGNNVSGQSNAYKANITIGEIKNYVNNIPADAFLETYSKPKFVMIRNKFPVSFVNSTFLQIIRNPKTKETHERRFYRGLLKLSTEALGQRAFAFSLFRGKGLFGSKGNIKLENDTFNKMFKVISDDELKIRQMYTPLSMELSVKRMLDKQGVQATDLQIVSNGKDIYFMYTIDPQFMVLNRKSNKLDASKLLHELYTDFIMDIYTLYYLVSIMFIPSYLD